MSFPTSSSKTLHDVGVGVLLYPGGSTSPDQAKRVAGSQIVATPLTMIDCPTRRQAIAYPPYYILVRLVRRPSEQRGGKRPARCLSRSDYAMNGGEFWTYAPWPHPVQNEFGGPANYAGR